MDMKNTNTLSAHSLRQMAFNLSAWGAASVERQLSIHVTNGDITTSEAQMIRNLIPTVG
jgi:hypothetical protein